MVSNNYLEKNCNQQAKKKGIAIIFIYFPFQITAVQCRAWTTTDNRLF